MTRRGLATALLAVLGGTSLLAGEDSKAIYTCGTVAGTVKRAEGRLKTGNLSTLVFSPDSRSLKPVMIPYKSIKRLEYGRTPPPYLETSHTPPITVPCALQRQDRYLTIVFEEVPPDDFKTWDASPSKDQKDKSKQDPKNLQQAKEYVAVFEIGDRALRPTLRILETRSGKRIKFQDAAARKAAR